MPDPAASSASPRERHDQNPIDTVQSLVVAFVIAMTFRAFVTEGFVIPTGSMAPTLLGQHFTFRAPETGWRYDVGFDGQGEALRRLVPRLSDPIKGSESEGSGIGPATPLMRPRSGDRILVNKLQYAFSEPKRFDVVVFKNPTNPNGSDGNYIKRLIGLPGEAVFLVDGDVFAAPLDQADDPEAYRIQRKPEHVQRAVWQPIFRSDRLASDVGMEITRNSLYGDGWTFADGRYSFDGSGDAMLEWNKDARTLLNDWAAYNQLSVVARNAPTEFVGDLRIAGTVIAGAEGLEMVVQLDVRDTSYEWRLDDGRGLFRMRLAAFGDIGTPNDEGWNESEPFDVPAFAPGTPVRIECWHVDQRLVLLIDDEIVADMPYEWGPRERLQRATNGLAMGDAMDDLGWLVDEGPKGMAQLRIRFAGAPVALERVAVDRDIRYRSDAQLRSPIADNPAPAGERPYTGNRYFGTHPEHLALIPEDHFFMLGDNSTASSDSRAWGYPHPIVAEQLSGEPFLVHRSLLLGKAWVVYFPALHPVKDGGRGWVPNFGNLRFIR